MRISLFTRIITLCLGIFMLTPAISGRTLSPEEALKRAGKHGPARIGSLERPNLVATLETPSAIPAIYIFSHGGSEGSLFLSADDSAPAVLGYTDQNIGSISEMAPNLQWWLKQYVRQIEFMQTEGTEESKGDKVEKEDNDWSRIEPMVMTKWSQDAPYWDQCPEFHGQRCVTGCVATAMAQVMNYFQYPSQGKGLISYTPPYFSSSIKLNVGKHIDWDNMLNEYIPRNYTQEEADAVAYLMAACGFSVKMQYSPIASGAYAVDVATALIDNFFYDKAIQYMSRDFFTYDQWSAMIYDNLSKIGPVLYGGQSEEGGHEFVCDGYDGDGFFHFNWGWGGVSDGYFRLDALNPMEQGIGGALGGFHFYQDILLGVQPDTGKDAYIPMFFYMYGPLRAMAEDDILYLGSDSPTLMTSSTYEDVRFNLGFIVENMDGSEDKQYFSTDLTDMELQAYYYLQFEFTDGDPDGCPSLNLSDLNLEEGREYKFTLATLDCDDPRAVWEPVATISGAPNFIYITSENGVYNVTNIENGRLKTVDPIIPDPVYYNKPNKFGFTLVNDSPLQLTRHLCLLIFDKGGQIVMRSGLIMETVNADSAKEITFDALLSPFSSDYIFQPGKYYLTMVDLDNGNILMDSMEIYMTDSENPGNNPDDSAVKGIEADSRDYEVVTIDGRRLTNIRNPEDIKNLSKGIYIINGKKIVK